MKKHSETIIFLETLYSACLFPLITHPTRIKDSSATLIDNIFTNVLNKKITSGLIIGDISDHLPIFQLTYTSCLKPDNCYSRTKRIINSVSLDSFKNELDSINWETKYSIKNPNRQYTYFENKFCVLYDKWFPLRKIKLGKINKPRLTKT